MQENCIFLLSSVAKPIVTAAALRLVENGRMSLGDPVRRWLPEFTPRLPDGRVPEITIHHLLTHAAGLTYVFMEPQDGPYHRLRISNGFDRTDADLDEIKQALSAYAQWTKTVPDSLTSAVRLVHYPPAPAIPEPLRGASAVVIMACYTGSTAEGEALVKPLRSIGTPLLDTFRPMPYAEIATVANDPPDAPPLFTFANGGGVRDISSDVIDAVLRIAGDRAAGIFVVEARHAGGALARQPEDAMPFGFRSPWLISALASAPTPQVLEGAKRSVAALLEALKPALTGEVLINSLDPGNTGLHLTRAGYSEENYRKLVALKDKYDPANVFRFNHNIVPSKGGTPISRSMSVADGFQDSDA